MLYKGIGIVLGLLLGIPVIGVDLPSTAAPPPKETASGTHTQNWDRNIPGSTRFTILPEFNNQAVRDNNTGLVWEQAPDTTPRAWIMAAFDCLNRTVGGTVGWRLPSVVELRSVQDPSLPPPFVPASVFSGIQPTQGTPYWSATGSADFPTSAWTVPFGNGQVGTGTKTDLKWVWCVRGPMQESAY